MRLADIKSWLVPGLIISLVVRALITGGTVAESLAIGFLCALYGVELWFYLHRKHQIEKRQFINIKKELTEIRTHVAALRLDKIKTGQQAPLGNVSWQSK